MLTAAALVALLNNPFVQAGGMLALRGVGNGIDDFHAAIQLDLYHRQTLEILYRGQVLAYVYAINHRRKYHEPSNTHCNRQRAY
jgi:hypothetical protein